MILTGLFRYLPILSKEQICADLLKDGINIVPRRVPTLGNSLSHSFFNSSKIQSFTWLHFKGNYCCGGTSCPCCRHVIKGNVVCSYSTEREHKSFFNCNTKYVVYIIICKTCTVQYVGRTNRRLRDRFYEHLFSNE